MTSYIDKKFINMMSSSLEKFKWRRDNIATCRCFVCGDSKRSKTKTRGYFYANKGQYYYKCHNCGFSCTIRTALENVAPQLAREYALESYKQGFTGSSFKDEVKPEPVIVPDYIGTCISFLPDNHYAKKYVRSRKIPEDKEDLLYYCPNFSIIAQKFMKTSLVEPRLVIPFFDEKKTVVGVQGRAFNPDAKIRYITYKSPHVERLWYGIERVNALNDVYVVEGPLDSLFIPNAIAMVGSSYPELMPNKLSGAKLIFAFDNEPRNVELHRMMEKAIDNNHSIVIWPNIKEKDINEMIVNYGYEKTKHMLDSNTYSGNHARLKFSQWRKS